MMVKLWTDRQKERETCAATGKNGSPQTEGAPAWALRLKILATATFCIEVDMEGALQTLWTSARTLTQLQMALVNSKSRYLFFPSLDLDGHDSVVPTVR